MVHAAVDFAPEQAGGLENAQVFRDRRERHGKRRGQSLDGGFTLRQAREDGAAGGVRERAEGGVELRGGIVNHTVYYSTSGPACQVKSCNHGFRRFSSRTSEWPGAM